MLSAQARWLLLIGLSSTALLACGGEEPAQNPGGAGMSSGGSGGGQVAGSPSGGTTSAGSMNGGSGGSDTAGGSAGASAGGTDTGGGGGGAGGTGGSGGGDSGGGGSGGEAGPTKTAQIMGVNGNEVEGTVTFTQGATMTKMVLTLTKCPDGAHSSHLHANNDCGNNAEAAGNHWPNGEMLGDYTCTNGMVTHEHEKPIALWTVGGDAATDITKHAFMVHAMPDSQGSGARIGCGTFPP